jgi:hypothetical protein
MYALTATKPGSKPILLQARDEAEFKRWQVQLRARGWVVS